MDRYAEMYICNYSKIVKFYSFHATLKMSQGLPGAINYILKNYLKPLKNNLNAKILYLKLIL